MKTSLSKIYLFTGLAGLVIGASLYFSSSAQRSSTDRPTASSATESVVIPVKGMSCMACAAKTKQALRSTSGVAEVEVNLDPGSVAVKYDGSLVTPQRLADVINRIGYQAGVPALGSAQ